MNRMFSRKKLPRHPVVVWSRLKAGWPFLIWLLAILSACYLYYHGVQVAPIVGVVEKTEEMVSPLELARLEAVFVLPGDTVTNGQPLAQLDASLKDVELRIEDALTFEEAETVARFQSSILGMKSTIDNALISAEMALSTEKRNLARETAELDVLDEELQRFQKLVESRLMDVSSLSMLKARKASLGQGVKLYPQVIASLEDRVTTARKESDRIKTLLESDDPMVAIEKRLDVRRQFHKAERERLLMEREHYTLRANHDGIVSRVFQEIGDIISPGLPVLSIIGEKPQRVVGFLPEAFARDVEGKMQALVQRRETMGEQFTAEVESVGPEIMGMPAQVASIRAQPVRGRRVVLRLLQEHDLIPGETVSITMIAGKNAGVMDWLRDVGRTMKTMVGRFTRSAS